MLQNALCFCAHRWRQNAQPSWVHHQVADQQPGMALYGEVQILGHPTPVFDRSEGFIQVTRLDADAVRPVAFFRASLECGFDQCPITFPFRSGIHRSIAGIVVPCHPDPDARGKHARPIRCSGDLFGADELRQTERMTLLHEAGHMVVHHAEQSGADAWGVSVAALDDRTGKAGDAIREWAGSDDGAIAHPDVRQLMLCEADKLDALQARVRAGDDGLYYDADAVRQSFQAIKSRADYRNFQENMGDAFMAITLRQEGVDVTNTVAGARAQGDLEHNTRDSLRAIGALTKSSLAGMDTRQLAVRAAQVVQEALGIG